MSDFDETVEGRVPDGRDSFEVVRDLYHKVFDLDVQERERYLDARNIPIPIRRELGELLGQPIRTVFKEEELGGFSERLLESLDRQDAEAGPAEVPSELREFGKYLLLQELGRGGQGVVFLAEDTLLRRKVAVKMLTGAALQSPRVRERFQREAEITSRLSHANICGIHEVGEEQGIPFIAMQYIKGETLADLIGYVRDRVAGSRAEDTLIDRARRSWDGIQELLRVFARAASALHVAHEAGLVHRDIKPANIMIQRDGEPMILDFGVARDLDSHAGHTLTVSGQLMGTPAYMPPEQVKGERVNVDRRADVYSLMATLYECLTLRRPFMADSLDELFDQIRTRVAANPRRYNPWITKDLATVIEVGMEREAKQRYATAERLEEDLRRVATQMPIKARAAGLIRRTRKWARARPAHAVAVIAGTLLLVSAVALSTYGLIEYARTMHRFRSEAAEALEAGQYVKAREAIAKALERSPTDGATLLLLSRVDKAEIEARRERDLERAGSFRESARSLLQQWISVSDSNTRLAGDLTQVEKRVFGKHTTEEENVQYWQMAKRLETMRQQALAMPLRILDAVADAERAEGRWGDPHPDNDRIRADLHMIQWRAAMATADQNRADAMRSRVEQLDTEGRYAAELLGRRQVTVRVAPSAAHDSMSLHLFEYVPYGDRVDGSAVVPRLVPSPTVGTGPASPLALMPGTPSLQIEAVAEASPAAEAGLHAHDLVLAIDAFANMDSFLAQGAAAGAHAGRCVASVNGVNIDSTFDLKFAAGKRPESAASDTCVFTDSEEPVDLDVRAVRWLNPARALTEGIEGRTLMVECLRNGERITLRVEPGVVSGLRCRRTDYPLACSEHNVIVKGSTFDCDPGSYLILATAPSMDPARIPFAVPRATRDDTATVDVTVDLLPSGSTPPGFVYVPPGTFQYGGGRRPSAAPAANPYVEAYFMAVHEVTNGEWFRFVNTPKYRERAAESGTLLPRDPGGVRVREFDDGRYGPLRATDGWPLLDSPVWGVSYKDAQQFVEWRNALAEERGERWVYDLPSAHEWEKAARGVDGRFYPWGNRFDPSLTLTRYHEPGYALDEPAGAATGDESVYGILGLGGSRQEWTTEKLSETKELTEHALRGGSWFFSGPGTFNSTVRHQGNIDATNGSMGVRLVARLRGAESSVANEDK